MAEKTGRPRFDEYAEVGANGSADRADEMTNERQVGIPPPRSNATPLRMLLLVAVSAVVITLAIVFFAFRAFVPGPTAPSVAGVSVAATPIPTVAAERATPIAPVAQPATLAPQATPAPPAAAAAAPSTACTTPLGEAQTLVQARRWSDAAAKLEAVRNQCDVVGPLYDAYLNQARALADDERAAEAITFFDKALQVKNGTEATNEKALAVAYKDGRAAVDSGDLDAAIANLSRVQLANPGYAHGNTTLNLINAYLAQGDALVSQSKCTEALSDFQRADVLKPNESAITQRISSAQQCGRPTLVPLPPAPIAVSAPPPPVAAPPLEPTVRFYYDAINSRRFGDAYSVLSSAAQASQSLASFAGRFGSTRSIGVRYIDGVSSQGSSAQLSAHTQTVTQDRTGLVTACSRVAWVLILEGGQWRRDIRSDSNNEFGERC